MRLALALAFLLMSGPTWAAEIAGPRAVACLDRSVFERMFRVDGAGDREATISLMEQAMRAGRCSPVRPGMAVRIEERADRYVCVARIGSTAPCVWMLARDVNP